MRRFVRLGVLVATAALTAGMLPLAPSIVSIVTGVDIEASASAVVGTLPAKWKSISSPGSGVTCAVSQSGQLWCWGKAEGPRGFAWTEDDGSNLTVGDGPVSGTAVAPARIGSATNWTKVDTGFDHACALNSATEIWCWGSNDFGELGVGSVIDSKTPSKVYLPASGWTDVAVGRDRTCGLRGQTAWCWGDNTDSYLFNAQYFSAGSVLLPRIQDKGGLLDQVSSISVGTHFCMTRLDGNAGCTWNDVAPTLPLAVRTTWTSISTRSFAGPKADEDWWDQMLWVACAIRSDGTAWCFGVDKTEPTQLGNYSDWQSLSFTGDQPHQPVCGLRAGVVTCFSVYGRELGKQWAYEGLCEPLGPTSRGFTDSSGSIQDVLPWGWIDRSRGNWCYYKWWGIERTIGPDLLEDYTSQTWALPSGVRATSVSGGFFTESVSRHPDFLRWGRLWVLGSDGGLYVMGDKGRNERQDGRAENYPMEFARALVSAPTLSSVTGSGTIYVPTTGGKRIALNGTYLTGITSVTVGGAEATSFTESDDGTTLSVVVPTGSLGAASIVVSNNAGSATLNSAVTYGSAPSAPTIGSASSGAGSATVTWSGSSSAGTTAITSYVVTATPGDRTCIWTTGALSCVVSGLTNGVSYTFTVQGVSSVGAGLPSASSSAVVPFTFPSAPQLSAVTPGSTSIDVSWTPGSDGGAEITGFTAVADPGGYTCTTDAVTSSCSIMSLSNGTPYTVSIYATNAGGDGAVATWPTTVTPRTVPSVPRTVRLTAADRSLRVAWTAPLTTGGAVISKYTATATPGGAQCEVAPPTVACTIVGLTNGTEYSVGVVATNPAGDSSASSPILSTPVTTPGKPTFNAPEVGDGQVTLSWRAPSTNGGSAVTGYSVIGTPSGACTTTGALTCRISGLSNGAQYSFTVTASNIAGAGTASTSTTATPRTTPGDPTAVAVSNGVEQLTVSWGAPVDNGGAPVTGYIVTAQPGGATCQTAADVRACVLSELDNGTQYAVSVQAINAAGEGSASDQVNGTPRTIPDSPDGIVAAPDNRSALVSWQEPPVDGGAPITSYRVTTEPAGGTCTTSETSCTVTSLTNGRSYVFLVSARNEAGWSELGQSESTLVAIVPSQPKSVVATGKDGAITITWQKPIVDGGSAVTQYTVYAAEEPVCTWRSGAMNCTASGLINGASYEITVTATNALGEGPTSQPVSAIPGRVPARPTGVVADPLTSSAEVSWIAPEDDGGFEVTSYKVTAVPGGRTCTANGQEDSCTVSGLTVGSQYTFSVVANNARGKSPVSTSSAVRIVGPPGAVRGLYGVGGSGSATLYFSAPAVTGGSSVNRYTVTCTSRGQTVERETTKTTYVVTGLAKRTAYSCAVEAENQYGLGPARSASVTTK